MKLFVGLVAAVGLLFVLALTTKGATQTNQSTEARPQSMQTVQSDVASGGQLLDVRTPAEYAEGHVAGAANWSLQRIQAGELPDGAKDKPVYVYCQSGNRSAQATAALRKAGFTNIIDLGAMSSVQKLGGTITTEG